MKKTLALLTVLAFVGTVSASFAGTLGEWAEQTSSKINKAESSVNSSISDTKKAAEQRKKESEQKKSNAEKTINTKKQQLKDLLSE